ncbi:hypothetical protein [uncultured Flavobacterium sp.]|uniref:hypothetical protein n=1 Tax=uncultured Flavobacterium sp. TaxID=165435 RepID=UPI0030EC8349|tara:strand:- start:2474 stop:2650 length:177 start_codon:yes stop_codon:yes gene_type:complete
MKKVMMLAMLVLGTTAMVNAQTTPVKATSVKEVKMGKQKKSHRKEVKEEAKKVELNKK